MNFNLYSDLLSRKKFIEEQIAGLSDNARMSRLSLNQQLDEIKDEIIKIETSPAQKQANATLTFSGDPVDGSRGIRPDFAAKALSTFSDIVNSFIGKENIENSGGLYITNIATGSFGFMLRENETSYTNIGQGNLDLDTNETITKKAVDDILLFFKNADAEDDDLSERFGDLNEDSLDKIRKFINVLNLNNALCSIKTSKSKFSFSDFDHVLKIKEVLVEDNIKKREKAVTGFFIGILPYSRTGEFQETGSNDIIKIKIPKKVELPNDTKSILKKTIHINIRETVYKDRKPSYTLLETEHLI